MRLKSSDMFRNMFTQQEEFLNLLTEKRNHPEFPLDISKKESQTFLKTLSHECMHELFEANMHLKNSKMHRSTELQDFDKEAYIEEIADVFHYLIGICIYSGIDIETVFDAFMKKGEKNFSRINSGY